MAHILEHTAFATAYTHAEQTHEPIPKAVPLWNYATGHCLATTAHVTRQFAPFLFASSPPQVYGTDINSERTALLQYSRALGAALARDAPEKAQEKEEAVW